MRIINPTPKLTAKESAFIAYSIDIKVDDVELVHIKRLTEKVERYLRGGAQRVIIATNQTEPTKFDLTCAIRYPTAFNKRALQEYLRFRAIAPCFGEGKLEGRAVHVHVKPLDNLDDSTFDRLRALWSDPPWKLEFEGHGSSVVRASAPGLQ